MRASINILTAWGLGLCLSACGGGGSSTASTTPISTPDKTTPSSVAESSLTIPETGARLLAAQCFQCHGTNGHALSGIDSLNGASEDELIKEMLEMKADSDLDDIMHRQARAYSDAQIRLLAGYIASLPASASKPANVLGGSNDAY